jgi:thiol-disulfide isomerase/thioredoxin
MTKGLRRIFGISGVIAVMAGVFGGIGGAEVGRRAQEFPRGAFWLNGGPVSLKDLRGKVVLVDFWEYTCVNCLRTLPYLKKWHEKYAAKGLVIIGVHAPEFVISEKRENVEAFAKREGLTYPIVLDNDRRIWRAYQGAAGFWPRKYLMDAYGIIRYDIIGEGAYEKTEERIQKLLKEADHRFNVTGFVGYAREEDEPRVVCYPQTAETYAGYERGRFSGLMDPDTDRTYRASPMAEEGHIALEGRFRVEGERIVHTRSTLKYEDSIRLKWKGSELNAVMEPGETGLTELRVRIDGKPVPPAMRGRDLVEVSGGDTVTTVDFPRMYQLVAGKKWGEFSLQLSVKDKGFSLYAFTFGACAKPDGSK